MIARADAEDRHAAIRLARLLVKRGDLDEAEHGDLDGAEQIWRLRADAGDGLAALDLADMLAGRGDLDGAKQTLRASADVGNGFAVVWLARLLARHGELDEPGT